MRHDTAHQRLDGEALAATATTLGIGIVEDEPCGKIVLHPVHRRSDQIEHRRAVDEEYAARRFDLLVELHLIGHIVDRIGKARTYPARRRKRDADRPFRRLSHRLREDRKSVVEGKSVPLRVDLGGRRSIKKKKIEKKISHS